jgi:hypothetical protein
MPEVALSELKQAVEGQHGGTATFVQSVPVHEVHNGETVWDRTVHVFDLKGHPGGAFRAYAWSYELDGRRAPVLRRAAYTADQRSARGCSGCCSGRTQEWIMMISAGLGALIILGAAVFIFARRR